MRTGGQILVDHLALSGVERVYGVPGESFLPVLDALYDVEAPRFITCRQEGGAAMMADAEARLTGRPGVAFVTRGPGATNASAGVHIASQDSVPLVLLVGQVERAFRGREAFQEVDYQQFFGGLAKWVEEVESADRLAEALQRAFAIAAAGRPGPVVLSLPEDVLAERSAVAPAPVRAPHGPAPSAAAIRDLEHRLRGAKRPLLWLGGGGWTPAAWHDVQRFAQAYALPVGVSFRRQSLFDNQHPCYAGHLGLAPHSELKAYAAEADLLLVLGSRLSEASSQGYSLIPLSERPNQAFVHIHNDPEELGRVYRADSAILAGMEAAAAALAALPGANTPPWQAETERLHQAYRRQAIPPLSNDALDYAAIVAAISNSLDEEAIVANGAGNYAIWINRFHAYRRFGSQLAPCCGSMGYGLPAAIAAKLAAPERQVVAFAGDGCFLMTGQELATAVHLGLDLVVIVVNNRQYGTIRMHQERDYPGRPSATALTNPDFAALARAYGAFGERVETTEAFAAAFERAKNADGPALIELMVDPDLITPDRRLA